VGITRLSDAAFTGVSIDATTSYAGFNASRLSFTSNKILVELKGLPIAGFIRLNLEGDTFAPVPEPATMSMMLGAFGVIGLVVRRRRAVSLK
jgi:PEP-CTERM motif